MLKAERTEMGREEIEKRLNTGAGLVVMQTSHLIITIIIFLVSLGIGIGISQSTDSDHEKRITRLEDDSKTVIRVEQQLLDIKQSILEIKQEVKELRR